MIGGDSIEAILEVRELCKSFGGVKAASNVTFAVRRGSIHGLIGPNGAGKSTTINMLCGFLKPDTGSIRFQGIEIGAWQPHRVAATGIGRTFQIIRCFKEMSVMENVLVGAHTLGKSHIMLAGLGWGANKEESFLQQKALVALEQVGLDKRADVLAGGLSFGELRLMELARAIVSHPKLLLVDEPASGLSQLERRDLAQLLLSLKREGMTILVVEHDMKWLMPLVDYLVVLDYGRVIAEGTPEEIKRDQRVIEAYLGGGNQVAGTS